MWSMFQPAIGMSSTTRHPRCDVRTSRVDPSAHSPVVAEYERSTSNNQHTQMPVATRKPAAKTRCCSPPTGTSRSATAPPAVTANTAR
jgi:hypothetical protein